MRCVPFCAALLSVLGFVACSGDDDGESPQGSATGGTSSSGGATSGGASASGGAASGGAIGSGGTTSGGSSGSGGASNSSGGSAGASASPGCNAGTAPSEGSYTVDVDGQSRSYYLVPSQVTDPVPLVISFHGYGSNGQADVGTFQLPTLSGGEAVLAYPDGVVQEWVGQGAVGWDTRGNDTPDIAFAAALIDQLEEEHCIDRTRIFVIGFSWGGWMSGQVACALGDRIRAFSTVAGGAPQGSCQGAVPGIVIHGEADMAEPFSSGEAARDSWSGTNGCSSSETATAVDGCVARDDCEAPLFWCTHPGGHELPGPFQNATWDFLMGAP